MNWWKHWKLHRLIKSIRPWHPGEIRECWICHDQWQMNTNDFITYVGNSVDDQRKS